MYLVELLENGVVAVASIPQEFVLNVTAGNESITVDVLQSHKSLSKTRSGQRIRLLASTPQRFVWNGRRRHGRGRSSYFNPAKVRPKPVPESSVITVSLLQPRKGSSETMLIMVV